MDPSPPHLESHHEPLTDVFPRLGESSKWEITHADRESFATAGHLAPLELLSEEQVDGLRRRLSAIGDSLGELGASLYEIEAAWRERPDETVLHFLGAWRVDELFHDLIFHPGATVPAAQLLGVERLRFWHDQVFWKPAHHPGVVPWHQDWSYWSRTTPQRHITVYIALDDMDEENGCLQVVPGSHLWGELPAVEFGGAMEQLHAHLSEAQREAFAPVTVPLRAGQASVHHSGMIHGSLANRSARPRRGIVLNYMCAQTKCADGESPLLAGSQLIEAGGLVEGPFFPLVYERPR
jgi:hypothetical protein